MVSIKSVTAAPDFKSPSRHTNELILGMSVRWRNAGGGLKDKQMDDFILIMALISHANMGDKKVLKLILPVTDV